MNRDYKYYFNFDALLAEISMIEPQFVQKNEKNDY